MFDTVLVANRGEIAVRVIRTLRAMGVRSVAVYSDADAGARHVRDADVAVRIGPPPAAASYLSIEAILDAAARTGAQAVHPGYGFLSENAAFARACACAGLIFVGPPADAIEAMGDKIRAKSTVAAAGVPVIPGSDDRTCDDDALAAAADVLGYPVLLKPSAGGGGKGMRVVRRAQDLPEAIASARREARGAFGDGTLLVEQFIATARHIEIQVLADARGAVVHLGERECSLQRRHQKIIEESPSVLLDAAARARMGQYAVAVAQAVGYTSAGTVEFIVPADSPDQFLFLEMNTRLQVEHPVTELVTGLDLVAYQLRVAAGEPLGLRQDAVTAAGHAVQARIYAEDPANGFLPTGGPVLQLREPAGVRVDSGLRVGDVVGSDYDPLLVKVIAHGPDRETALRRLDAALAQTSILGLGTNVAYLRGLLADADVQAGKLDTGLVARRKPPSPHVPDQVFAAAALRALLALEPTEPVVDPFALPGGWRIGEPAWTRWRLQAGGFDPVEVRTRGRVASAELAVGDSAPTRASARWDDGDLIITLDQITCRYSCAVDGAAVWLGHDGHSWELHEQQPLDAARSPGQGVAGAVHAPMPGTIIAIDVTEGQQVTAGARLLVLEAMKMEHVLTAPIDGVVRDLRARLGTTVERHAVLLVVDP
ncbi:MAG: acetyl-CoA/propionyl-CoA carboxylase, biotin carboxylase, biotin carboxyl carrier protein [Pseudonocardiales bacterium]|jgi:acetyl-CoA/propionyl-CoA carboxylase biotin carboxyl carrier protein|nr:acetyl-CoA/propionyl-CoA carboxylase, biotin carboxylase, biotin carboxyl carrier protein [Pseudonocardiales bacterium]